MTPPVFEGLRGARVLITGGCGFIGSSLARQLLVLGSDVTLVDSLIPAYGGNLFNISDIRDRLSVNIADVRDPHALSYLVRDRDFLFNLAGQTSHLDSMKDPFTDLEINAKAQLSILEACRLYNPRIKIIFASTRQIYGKPDYLPVDESHPVRPIDVNGINKLAGEMYHKLYYNAYGIRSCALRMTNTYGPGMRVQDARQTFLGVWIRRLIDEKPIVIYGNGRQLRDFNFVSDAVDALLLAAVKPEADGAVFNLGSREFVSLADLAGLLVRMVPGARCEVVEFPGDLKTIDIGDYYADYGKIARTLDWEPRIALAEGLARTLEYYRINRAHYWKADDA
mgnify:FL=1